MMMTTSRVCLLMTCWACLSLRMVAMETAGDVVTTHDVLTNGTKFYYRKLSTVPAKRATIEFSVEYETKCCPHGAPRLDFYTTDEMAGFPWQLFFTLLWAVEK